MIILNKKFDIRQWVVVTSWQPLRIWYFDECYLRFTADNYDPSKIHNKFMHLTNNCIASQSKNFNESSIEGNMWPGDTFQKYLAEQNGGQDIYATKIQPQVKQGIIGSVLAARDMVIHRENAHEMFGYDFMVDTNLNVWLIEVNSSPSMEHSTVRQLSLIFFSMSPRDQSRVFLMRCLSQSSTLTMELIVMQSEASVANLSLSTRNE